MAALAWASPFVAVATFAAGAGVTRWAVRGRYLFDWDSLQFALGMARFDLAAHRPHPPGYLGYIALGRLFGWLFGMDAQRSLVLLSILAEVITVCALLAWLSRRSGPWAGAAGAVLLLTSPLFWLYGETALTYALEPGLSLLGFVLVERAVRKGGNAVTPAALAIGAIGAIRPTTEVFLLPLFLYGMWRVARAMPPGRRRAVVIGEGFGGLALATMAWAVPLLVLAGGPRAYLNDVIQLTHRTTASSAVWRAGFAGFALNTQAVVAGLGLALGAYLPLVTWKAVTAAIPAIRPDSRRPSPRVSPIMVAWTAPALAFLLLVHIGQLAYVLYLVPALLLPAGTVTTELGELLQVPLHMRAQAIRGGLLALCAAVNVAMFVLPGSGLITNVTVRDRQVAALVQVVQRYPPMTTLLLTDPEGPSSYRTALYYLPNYRVVAIGRDDHQRAGEFFDSVGGPEYDLARFDHVAPLALPPTRIALVLDARVVNSVADPSRLRRVGSAGPGHPVYSAALDGNDPPVSRGRWIYLRKSDADRWPGMSEDFGVDDVGGPH